MDKNNNTVQGGSKVLSEEIYLQEDEKFPSIQGFLQGGFKSIKKEIDDDDTIETYREISIAQNKDDIYELIVNIYFNGNRKNTVITIYIEISFENKSLKLFYNAYDFILNTLQLFFADINNYNVESADLGVKIKNLLN